MSSDVLYVVKGPKTLFEMTWKEVSEMLKKTDIYMPMGITAENVAEKFSVTRERMEQMAVESHKRASKAVENGDFDKEIIPVLGKDKEGNEVIFKRDEGYRKGTNMETLATL